ncbi:MAG TPA: hypothetical protein VND19_07470 [Acetobacteraceae bacterium]|nr:hypothetical protein [Acetobacteraceae bacterium]
MKPGSRDKRISLLIAGAELSELKRLTWQMSEAFGLDARIGKYQGKRPIGLYSWDFECLLAVLDNALNDPTEYPDKTASGYDALTQLAGWLRDEYREAFGR